jgi:hypothetical protein
MPAVNQILSLETPSVKSLDAIAIRSYSSIPATTDDSWIFGTDLILETVESAKMLQNSLQVVRFWQENGYDSQHCFEPRGHVSIWVTDARIKRFRVHQGKVVHNFIQYYQCWIDECHVNREITPRLMGKWHIPVMITYQISQQIWQDWGQHNDEHMREDLPECWIRWSKPPQSKEIKSYETQWEQHIMEKGTRVGNDFLKSEYLYLFPEQPNLEDEIFVRGVGLWHPDFWPFLFLLDFFEFLFGVLFPWLCGVKTWGDHLFFFSQVACHWQIHLKTMPFPS